MCISSNKPINSARCSIIYLILHDWSREANYENTRIPHSSLSSYLQIEHCMKTKLHYFIMLLFAFVVASCTTEPIESANSPKAENAVEVEEELLGIVNDHRISLGYTDLDFSDVAYEYANKHTDYMIAKGSINHDNFSARASDISLAVNASFVSENVAKDYDSAIEAFQKWLASSDHRKTIEGEFTHTAVSVKRNLDGKLYFTQLFYR